MLDFDARRKFKLVDMIEIMSQKRDAKFIDLLNNIRVGDVDSCTDDILKIHFVPQPLWYTTYLCRKDEANRYNEGILNSVSGKEIFIPVKDDIPEKCSMSIVLEVQNQKQCDTGALAMLLRVKINARVMFATNVDLSDRLINGKIGTVKYFAIDHKEVETITLPLMTFLQGKKGSIEMKSLQGKTKGGRSKGKRNE